MKIISINRELTTDNKVALETDLEITPELLQHITRLIGESSELKEANPQVESGLLVLKISSFSPELVKSINTVLDDAELALRTAEFESQKQEVDELTTKLSNALAAAAAFGVPIK